MRVNFASKRIEFTTGYRIDAAKWDSDKQRVRNGCTNKLKQSASEINASLLGYYTEVQEIFKKFEVEEIMPTPEQIKEAFNKFDNDFAEVAPWLPLSWSTDIVWVNKRVKNIDLKKYNTFEQQFYELELTSDKGIKS